ncbi:class I SAM-dependent methyltransferase [Candidatus Pacearchaeota archaeon]|nr:class I SAM-dependent methyltransferase [Candidatus Pacearchaeota archaeon]
MDEKIIKEYYEKHPEGISATKDIPEIFEMHQILTDNVIEISPYKLLDAGCGKGHTGESVSKYCKSYYGFDLSSSAIKLAKERLPHGSFLTGSLKNLPYKTNYFDCVICSEVIEHIPEYKKAIKELSRVTKKGKYVLITLPNRLNPDMKWRLFWKGKYTSQIYDNPPHYKELIKELNNNGLDVLEFSSFFYLPLWGESLPNFVKKLLMWIMQYYSQITGCPKGLYLFFKLRKRER